MFFAEGENQDSKRGIRQSGSFYMRRETGPVKRFAYAGGIVPRSKSEGTCMTDIKAFDGRMAMRNRHVQGKRRKDTDDDSEKHDDRFHLHDSMIDHRIPKSLC